MNVYAFIPARYQSSRLPGKPLVPIAGKPMIQHVYERAMRCREVTGVYVATDDERIADCVQAFGGQVVLTAEEHLSGTDRICEAATVLGVKPDEIVVNIQGDQPLYHESVIPQLIEPLILDRTILMSTLSFQIREPKEVDDPNHVKVVSDKAGFALYFSRSPIPFYREKGVPQVHHKHLGFYAYRMRFLIEFHRMPEGRLEAAEKLEQLRALENGARIRVVETSFDSIEVDVAADIRKVEETLAASASKRI